MKKVTAFIGTNTRKATYLAVQEFEKYLKEQGKIKFEYVVLSNYRIEFCIGCKACFVKGGEFCPLKDDRDKLLKKIEQSDGVIFATPNYSFQVSARLKNFIDRLSFIVHRPRFFNKAYTAVVAQGIYGGNDILKYLHFAGENLGFHVSKGCVVTTFEPMSPAERIRLSQEVEKAAERFYKELFLPKRAPSFFRLFVFRLSRTNVKYIDKSMKDYKHYKAKGWLESDYYYPVSLGPVKAAVGAFADFLAERMNKK